MKSNSQFKTMRHIETVRNYITHCIRELLFKSERHDQSKLQAPELAIFNEYTQKLRGITYGSEEYKKCMKEMKPAIDHHNTNNDHHPEFFKNGVMDMTLLDLVEMLCDWKAATLRHGDGNIYKSLEINQKRFGYSDDIAKILRNTADHMEENYVVYSHAHES